MDNLSDFIDDYNNFLDFKYIQLEKAVRGMDNFIIPIEWSIYNYVDREGRKMSLDILLDDDFVERISKLNLHVKQLGTRLLRFYKS